MRSRIVSLVLVIIFLASSLPVAHAQYSDVYGFGSREIAMGGAMTAEANGPAAAFYNPAALAKVKGTITSIGYTAVVPELSLTRLGPTPPLLFNTNLEGDPFNNSANPGLIQGIQLGMALPLGEHIVVGTSAHLPAKFLASAAIYNVDESFFMDYESRSNVLDTKLAVAYSPFPWLSFGVGTMISVNLEGDLITSLPIAAGNPTPAPAGPVEISSELEMIWDFAPTGGVWVKPFDFLELGVTYRGELELDTDLNLFINTDLNQGAGITQFIPVTVVTDVVFTPQQVAMGASFKPNDRLTIATDLVWVDWSDYEPPIANIGVGNLINTVFGGAPFPPGTVRLDVTPVPAQNFKDIWVPRIGVEYKFLDWLYGRAGYYFRESPVPIQAGLTNIADSNTHVFSGGVGMEYDDPLQIIKGKIFIDLHAQFLLLEDETNIKGPNVAINDPDNEGLPGYTEGGFLWSMGITTGIRF